MHPANLADDEDLQWYVFVHTQTSLCVIIDQYDVGEQEVNLELISYHQ